MRQHFRRTRPFFITNTNYDDCQKTEWSNNYHTGNILICWMRHIVCGGWRGELRDECALILAGAALSDQSRAGHSRP